MGGGWWLQLGIEVGRQTGLDLEVAGLRMRLIASHSKLMADLRRMYQPYLSKEPGDLHLQIKWDGRLRTAPDLDQGLRWKEGKALFTAPSYQGWIDLSKGEGQLCFSSAYPREEVDYFLRVVLAMLALQAGGVLFHAAGVVRREQACLFFGPSGAGKTTVARNSPSDQVMNDDLMLILPEGSGWTVHSTPFWHPTQVVPQRRSARLIALFRLIQDHRLFAETLTGASALAEWLGSVPVLTMDPTRSGQLLDIGTRILATVPAYRLHFLADDSFWEVVDELFGGGLNDWSC